MRPRARPTRILPRRPPPRAVRPSGHVWWLWRVPEPHRGRSAFVAVLAGLLALGLAALLALNTMLAQDAFVLSKLNQRSSELAIVEQSLAGQVADQEDPQRLALRAKALGLRPSGSPLFLRLPDGKVLGSKRVG